MRYIRKFWTNYNLNTIFFFAFYMAMCFPFVGHFYMTDTQPWALLMAIGFIVMYILMGGTREYNFYSNALLLFLVVCIVIGCLSMKEVGGYTTLMRSGANYASVFFITMAVYYMLNMQGELKEGWMKFAIYIWLVVGLIQKYVNAGFAREWLAKSRTDSLRGVLSLGSEPSFYGYMCLFFILFAVEFKRLRWLYVGILIYEIVFLANSSVTIVYLAVILFMWFLVSLFKRKKIAIGMIAMAIISFICARAAIVDTPQPIRILELVRKLIYHPEAAFHDASVVQRTESIVSAFDQFISSYGLPSGMSATRITSGYGALLVELGFFGIVAIILFLFIMMDGKYGFVTATAMTIIMFSGIQLACPMFSFYLGYCLYKKMNRIKEQHLDKEDGWYV